ncbi:GPN-loop GTPase 3 [Dictyocoela muelleri]|nr:GPN-loop GTPase 3 [Dictyocoela muelleri]
MGHAIFVMGPAGSGKTTLCKSLKKYGETMGRSFILVNMDPYQATDIGVNQTNSLKYTDYDISVTDYITSEDLMETLDIGPNCAILEAMAEIASNINELGIDTDEYYIFDFPGQLELFTHSESLVEIVNYCQKNHHCIIFYLMDNISFKDPNKFLSGSLMALLIISRFPVSYQLIRSKADQGCVCSDNKKFNQLNNELYEKNSAEDEHECVIDIDPTSLNDFDKSVYDFLEKNEFLNFLPLNLENNSHIENLIYYADSITQYCESQEPEEHIYDNI